MSVSWKIKTLEKKQKKIKIYNKLKVNLLICSTTTNVLFDI